MKEELTTLRDCKNYQELIEFAGSKYLLCNNITSIDPDVTSELWSQLRDDDEYHEEIYQYFLSDDLWKCERLNQILGYPYAYSEVLDLWVYGATDVGTSRFYLEIKEEDWRRYDEQTKS
jgi:hypothetical protein